MEIQIISDKFLNAFMAKGMSHKKEAKKPKKGAKK
jgi:hypothetical protein